MALAIASARLTFPGAFGDLLAARLDRPEGPVRACAVLAHCFTCGKDIRAAATISRTLAAEGIAVLRFDFTGLGSSDGDFANTSFSSNVDDLVTAARYLEGEHGPSRLLIGHSLGGATAITAATQLPSAAAVATMGAPHDLDHIRRLIETDIATIEREGQALVSIAGRSSTITKLFVDDLRRRVLHRSVATLGRALMIFHAPDDTIVDIESGHEIFRGARHPKSFVSLDGADHLLSRREDATHLARVLSAWAARYL